MNVLVVRLSSIGDVVHTLPALAALRAAGHETTWLVEPPAAVLLAGNPALKAVVVAPPARRFEWSQARDVARQLRQARFDVALDLQGLWKSAGWARVSGARRIVGYAAEGRREGASALILGEAVPLPAGVTHVIDKNLALLRAVGLEAVGGREFPLPPLPPPPIATREGDFALLDPGGGWPGKLWPAESFGALAARLREHGLRSLVAWGPGEQALGETVVAHSSGAATLLPPTSLLELAACARAARLMVAADTGPLHLACALGTPVVALFGPTDPARNGPFAAGDLVVRKSPACAPCYRRACAVHEGVMSALSVDEVASTCATRLAAPGLERVAR